MEDNKNLEYNKVIETYVDKIKQDIFNMVKNNSKVYKFKGENGNEIIQLSYKNHTEEVEITNEDCQDRKTLNDSLQCDIYAIEFCVDKIYMRLLHGIKNKIADMFCTSDDLVEV